MTDHSRNEPSNKEPKTLDYQAADLRPGKRASWARRLAAPFTVICLIVIVWPVTHLASRLLPLAYKAAGVTMPTRLQSSPPDNVTEFYRSEISPLLDAALQRNRRAADRAIALASRSVQRPPRRRQGRSPKTSRDGLRGSA